MRKRFFIKLFFFCITFVIAAKNSFSQHNPILANFSVFENNGKVFLNWQIVAGSTCNGIQIYRSSDSTNFIQIGDIAGICGSSSSAVSYSFTDENPQPNKINCYRLELGGNGSSEILSVEIIDIVSGGYQIRPNPVTEQAKIYFSNDSHLPMNFTLTDINGNLAMRKENITDDFFIFNRQGLSSGLYLFTIDYNNTVKVSGKIIITSK